MSSPLIKYFEDGTPENSAVQSLRRHSKGKERRDPIN
jgi:hypothetical protein